MILLLPDLPKYLAEDAEPDEGVAGGEVKACDHAADFVLRGFGDTRVELAGFAEKVEQQIGEASGLSGVGAGDAGGHFGFDFRFADQFIEAEGYGLAKIHGLVFLAGGDAHQPVAMGHLIVGEAEFFRTEENGDRAGLHGLTNQCAAVFEPVERVL